MDGHDKGEGLSEHALIQRKREAQLQTESAAA
jgi:hypothetical protein